MILSKKDKRFHVNTFCISTILPLKREDLSTLTVLEFLLRNKAKGYPTQASITHRSEELYALDFQFRHYLSKDNIIFEVNFSVVDDAYVEEKRLLEKAMRFIYVLAFDTTVSRYASSLIREQKAIAMNFLSRANHRPSYIVSEGLYQALDPKWTLSIPLYGTEKEIQKVKRKDLIDLHKRIVSSPKTASFVGPISQSKGEKALKKYLILDATLPPYSTYKRSTNEEVYVEKKQDILQSHIRMAFLLDASFSRYEAVLLNDLIGGLGTSRLFQHVREEKGLCYSIFSSLNPYTRLLIITVATDTQKVDAAIQAIQDVVMHLRFKKEELDQAKALTISSLYSSSDNGMAILSSLQNAARRNETYSIKEYVKAYQHVRLTTLNALAKQFSYQGAFVLKGGDRA